MKLNIIFWACLICMISGCNSTEKETETKAATPNATYEDTLATVSKQEPSDSNNINQLVNKKRKRINVSLDTLHDIYVLYGQEFSEKKWAVTYDTVLCTVGYNGIAKEGEKREGDGKTPSGTFELGAFFGYEDDLGIDSNYITLEPYHYWMSDASSPAYNTLIDYDPAPLIAEKMERNDHLYKYGIVIEYNTNPAVPDLGSAIFLHIYRSPDKPTAGCVAMAENNLLDLMYWLQDGSQAEITIFD